MPQTQHRPSPRRALGTGLKELMRGPDTPAASSGPEVAEIPLHRIDPNPVQPRLAFDPDALEQLATSIKADGVLQPLLVRRAGDRFELIVGERRLKASKLAGLATVPAVVRDIDPDRLLEVTLVENIQREDLNPIEVAMALQRMVDETEMIHEQVAERTGMSRASITNHLRLLKLPPSVQRLVIDGSLQMGHARALLPLDNAESQREVAEQAVRERLAVREVENLVRKLTRPNKNKKPRRRKIDPNVAAAIETLERVLQAPVRLRQRGQKGRIEIAFSSNEQLEAIYDRIVGEET